nr:hypothetical protein [Tanacetum cinerariifolium]
MRYLPRRVSASVIQGYRVPDRLPNQDFIEPLSDEEMVPFIKELGYTGKCDMLSKIHTDQMHQPWRTFAVVINRCISGKSTCLDRLRPSRVQVLWGMFYKENVDFVTLLWEDFMFQEDNRDISPARKENMPYPRFTKVIINHFISKHKTISMRNKIKLHTIQDDRLLGTLKYVSKTKDYYKYGALIPEQMINQAIKNSKAYKIYLAFATGKATPKKARKFKNIASPSKKQTLVLEDEPAKKPKRAKHPEPTKKSAPAKKDVSFNKPSRKKSTGVQIKDTLDVSVSKKKASATTDRSKGIDLLSEADLLEDAQLKKALKISKRDTTIHQAGSSSEGPDSDQSENESWGDSGDEANEQGDDEDVLENAEPTDKEKGDEKMTNTEIVDTDLENVNQEGAGNQVNDDAQATQKTEVPLPSSPVSSDYAVKYLNFDNIPLVDTKVVSLLDVLKKQDVGIIKEHFVPAKIIERLRQQYIPEKSTKDIKKIKMEHARKQQVPKETITSSDTTTLEEFDQKTTLFQTMTNSKSSNRSPKQRDLYHALMELILEDEDVIDEGVADKLKKKKQDDADKDEGPSTGLDRGLKRWKTSKDIEPSKKAKPLLLIMERGCQVIHVDYFINNDLEHLRGGSSRKKYTTSTTKTKAAKYDILGIKDMVPSFASNMVSKHDVYSTRRIITLTKVKVMKWYDYGYLEEIEVRREDQQLYKFKEGDFLRLYVHDIEDMLLLLMFTRRIIILKRVEDLQLGGKSYQKKLNITKPETFRSEISKKIPYTAYNNPQGIIYEDKHKRNRLMRTDELYKFSDGTLTSVRTVLHDIASNLRMDYLPKRRWCNLYRQRWCNLDRQRSRIMIKAIDKLLLERRLMRSLEKFVGGRDYKEDLGLLERTI